MYFQLITPSRSKQSFLQEGEQEYARRIRQYARFEIEELDLKLSNKSPPEIIAAEGALILKKAKKNAALIALDESGSKMSSQGLANLFSEEFNQGTSSICFAIGGPFGLCKSVKEQARQTISLSDFTFTAQFARLVLVEQIYRAISIIKGLPYHKE